jgi:poly-gamma-glutamate capsule biosynthesis protein CapA/YwtB (metallophosphatase superfamily)
VRILVNHFRPLLLPKRLGFVLASLLCCAGGAESREIVINAVGDIMLAGSAAKVVARRGYSYPFSGVAGELKSGDIAVGNLEAPISDGGEEFRGKRFRFRTAAPTAAALREAGFSLVTLANNHIMDFGREGLRQTLRALDGQNLPHAGAGEDLAGARRPVIFEADGKKIAFLAYSLTLPSEFFAGKGRPGTAPAFLPFFRTDIARAKANADYVVVSFHWGDEGAAFPKKTQVAAAHAAVEAGADVVLGHHPHVLQGIEFYRGRPILYSLGNFVFGSMSRGSDRSVIARLALNGERVRVELVPVNVLNREVLFRPVPLSGKKAKGAISRLAALSRRFGTTIGEEGGRFVAAGPSPMGGTNVSALYRH